MNYFPLYLYSEYSIHQSTVSLKSLIHKLKQNNVTTCAITDNGVMYGAYKYYKELVKNNIKPILGLKVKVQINKFFDTILLYAKNQEGYLNLLKISSLINTYTDNNNKTKSININDLLKLKKGLIVISCGSESVIYNLLRNNNTNDLINYINQVWLNHFENYYLGLSILTNNDLNNFYNYYETIKNLGFKMVLTNKINHLENNNETSLALKCLYNLDNINNLTEIDNNSYFNYTYDLLNNLSKYDLLFKHLDEINNLCGFVIDLNNKSRHFPSYDTGNKTEEQCLFDLSHHGLNKRLIQEKINNQKIYFDRLDYEFNIIKNMGFCGYFLIIYDYIIFAVKNNIMVGPGRGSGVASILAWSLGITDVNPLKYNLLFERFLNPERITMPDLDIDVPDNRINDVIDYLVNKYGKKNTARISNFSRFQQKSALEIACKALNISDKFYKSVKKIIDLKDDFDDEDAKSDELSLKELKEVNSELKQSCLNYPNEVGLMLDVASVLQGLPQNLTVHPSGYIIADANISNFSALINSNNNNIYQTQYQADDLESLGLLKIDFLSSNYLSCIKKITENIKQDNNNFVIPKDESNPNVYQMLRNGLVTNIFQVSSNSFKNLLKKMNVNCFNDIVAANALIRPGANNNIEEFVDCKLGKKQVTYLHPDLKPILEETNGIIIYQEQIMNIARKFAGYSLGKADILRRAVAKKKKEILEQERNNFITACTNNGYSNQVANDIYNYFVDFASFGFNKAHSVSYARFTYITAWLKCVYPEYFYSAYMAQTTKENILELIEEAKHLGVKTYLPTINKSIDSFKYNSNPKAILLSLSIINKLRSDIIKQIIEERDKNGLFKSLKDFINRCYNFINDKNIIYSLIFAGAFNEFKMTKKDLVNGTDYYINLSKFGEIPGLIGFNPSNEEYPYIELMEKEKEALGFNYSYTFVSLYNDIYVSNQAIPISQINLNKKFINTFGIIKEFKEKQTKKNDKMAMITLYDYESSIKVTIFNKVYCTCGKLAIGDKVIIHGVVEEWNNNLQLNCNSIKKIDN